MSDDKNKLRITPKSESREDKTVTMTIRIERELQEKFDEMSRKTNRSRNELINIALNFAVDRIELVESENDNNDWNKAEDDDWDK